jgi:tRNA A37 N6-isopentenylltransferase MiaA
MAENRSGGIAGHELQAMVLLPPRPWLHARCDLRFAHMVEQGALTEVKALLERKLDPNLPVMRAIGVADLALTCVMAHPGSGDRCRTAGDPPIRQAPIYLVRAPATARMASFSRSSRG